VADHQTMSSDFNLLHVFDGLCRGEHRNLDLDFVQFFEAQGPKTRVIRGCGNGAVYDRLIEREEGSNIPYAPAQMPPTLQSNKNAPFLQELSLSGNFHWLTPKL